MGPDGSINSLEKQSMVESKSVLSHYGFNIELRYRFLETKLGKQRFAVGLAPLLMQER
jgi:hypothetical protein